MAGENGHRPAVRLGGDGRQPGGVQHGDGRRQHGRTLVPQVARKCVRCRAATAGDEGHRHDRDQERGWATAAGDGDGDGRRRACSNGHR
jgi:hypothetical protein